MAEKMNERIRWGILGAGLVAGKMATALKEDKDSTLLAVASTSTDRAKNFADRFSIPRALKYQELIEDPEIDIVYIATTHNYHYDNAKMVLEQGKPVLLEKSFTVNAPQTRELIELAGKKNLFLMEAHWVRLLPSLIRLKETIASGIIGDVRQITIAFGEYPPPSYIGRLESIALAGGATLDKGVYPINFLCYMLNEVPDQVLSMCRISDSGVDETANYQFHFPSGALAQVSTSYALRLRDEAVIYGTKGHIFCSSFPVGESFTVNLHGGGNDITSTEVITEPNPIGGFLYELREVNRCLREGLKESPIMPQDETLAIMEVMDKLRQQWGLKYPFE